MFVFCFLIINRLLLPTVLLNIVSSSPVLLFNSLQMSTVLIESFSHPKLSWEAMNDPVMGGKSHSSVSIENGMGIFDGEVVDVPFLHAPGFITMRGNGSEGTFPDVSSCDAIQLVISASEPYKGYRISFGERHVPGNRFARGYKADFDAPKEMGTVTIPFDQFTVRWDDATGDAVVTCQEDENFCPDTKTLKDMKTLSLWGEGVSGRVHLEIESISATGCTLDGMVRSSKEVDSRFKDVSSSLDGSKPTPPLLFVGIAVVVVAFVVALIRGRKTRKEYEGLNHEMA